jgi:hypothetical protein
LLSLNSIIREAWKISLANENGKPERIKALTLSLLRKDCSSKLLKECNEAKFALLEKGQSILILKTYEGRPDRIQTKEIS